MGTLAPYDHLCHPLCDTNTILLLGLGWGIMKVRLQMDHVSPFRNNFLRWLYGWNGLNLVRYECISLGVRHEEWRKCTYYVHSTQHHVYNMQGNGPSQAWTNYYIGIVWKLLTYPLTVYPPLQSVSEEGYMVHDFYRGRIMAMSAMILLS
jgi:hypothetical protein